MPSNQYISREEAWELIRKFSAYQERSHKEVQDKLASLNQDPGTATELITQLMEADFLNEERFARAYVKGQFKHNDWGREKIKQGLISKGIHPNLVSLAMQEIDEEQYREKLKTCLNKKNRTLKPKHHYGRKAKLARYTTDLV